MGLDVSHDAFSGAYSAFSRFRHALAQATGGEYGMELWRFGPGYSNKTHPGLYAFFCHSDCDGEIEPELAGKLADEMEALLPHMDKLGSGGGHIDRDGGFGNVTRMFIAGCRRAAEANEPLLFG